MEIDADALVQTIEKYQEQVKNGVDVEFSRKTLADLTSGDTFYGIVVKPSIQGTFGGIPTNTGTEVLNSKGEIIPGFYAVGECAQEGVNGLDVYKRQVKMILICYHSIEEYSSNIIQ